MAHGGQEGFFSVSPPSVQRWWNGTRFMHVLKQRHRTTSPQRWAFFVPVHRALSALGAVTGSGVFWVVEMKRDPHAPFESAGGALLFELLLGQDTSLSGQSEDWRNKSRQIQHR
jgi:hypothetical protein